jgi:3-ketoacyl-CoA synthase
MQLVPEFMPVAELARAGANAFRRRVLKHKALAPYSPRFAAAFRHFGVHPGGKTVLDGVGRSLGLSDYDMEPSRMSLYRFGNTSSSGVWYAMAYKEAKRRLKRGDRVWQIALGSGFKCSLVVWKVLRDIEPAPGFNPWLDFIDDYPVDVPDAIGPTHKHYAFLKAMEEELRRIEENERGCQEPKEGVNAIGPDRQS